MTGRPHTCPASQQRTHPAPRSPLQPPQQFGGTFLTVTQVGKSLRSASGVPGQRPLMQ